MPGSTLGGCWGRRGLPQAQLGHRLLYTYVLKGLWGQLS